MKKTLNRLTVLFAFTVFISCDSDDNSNDSTPCDKTIWYEDKDGDGKGNPDVTISACEQPEGYVLDNTDDNDNKPSRVYDGSIDVSTIEKYNEFIKGDYIEVTGDLLIGHNGNGILELTNLEGLKSLTTIGGNFRLGSNSSLENLDGLENLKSVGGSVWLFSNTSLTSLSGLKNLTVIGGSFQINYSNISSLNGLENINSIGNLFEVRVNNKLTDFCAITNLIKSDGIVGNYNVSDNAYNPTIEDIKAGSCSQ